MRIKSVFILYLLLLLSFKSQSQKNDQVKVINDQVWASFTKAFETFDHELFASIHSKDLIRVSGNGTSIKHFTDYIVGYQKRWESQSSKQTISFRFLERIADDINGSERGIYRLTINPNTDKIVHYYGKFHVILVKENDQWKILVDYDSDENNTIDATTYNMAFAIDDFDKY